MFTITFKFEQRGLQPVTIQNVKPDQSILEVALINDIVLHHNCGGVCACSTCHLYVEKGDEDDENLSSEGNLGSVNESRLPDLNVGQKLQFEEMTATERFTRPSARYTEASLVKKLEELGIGRPSTYAPTISSI